MNKSIDLSGIKCKIQSDLSLILSTMADLEYVIYCRKSSEETDRQSQSIPDQIKVCMDYAEREKLTLMRRPKDFSMFETPQDIARMKANPNASDREQFKRAEPYFVIKEECSGKIPNKRPKRRHLIKMLRDGKIHWLISYSPDRQARNLLEAWELIDLIDREDIDLTLKYPTFHFDPNASWKMMLWIWFVFSKEYSDKLSEDVKRWKHSTVEERWLADGNTKHWYIIDNWLHKPHPKYFELIKKAFHMRIYENKSNREIKEFLDTHWYVREYQTWRTPSPISENALSRMREDSFYYWMLVIWEARHDLRWKNNWYKPMITEDEYAMLIEQKCNTKCQLSPSAVKDEYEQYVMPFERWFIVNEQWTALTFNLPNKNRFDEKLRKLQISKPEANLSDVVKLSQIRYRDANKNSKTKWLEVTAEMIDKAIIHVLKNFKVDKEIYEEYLKVAQNNADEKDKKVKEKRSQLQLQYNSVESAKKRYIEENAVLLSAWEEEAEIYNEKKKYYDTCLKTLKEEMDALDEEWRNIVLELEAFVWLMNNASKRYAKWSFVQKREISKLIFLNIVVSKEKKLHLAVKPIFNNVINSNGGAKREHFEQLENFLVKTPVFELLYWIALYRKINNSFSDKRDANLSDKERLLYKR